MCGLRSFSLSGLFVFAAAVQPNPNCSLPVLSVGQKLNSSKEVNRLVKKHKHVLIGFSAPSCINCCHWEPIYNETLGSLPSSVGWFRVDLDRLEAKALASTHDIDVLPAAIFFYERKPIKLLEVHRPQTLVGIVNRSLQPLPVLRLRSYDVDAFFDSSAHFGSPSRHSQGKSAGYIAQLVRVVTFFDKHVEDEDLEELAEGARAFAGRPLSFRFAQVVDAATRKGIMALSPAAVTMCDSVAKHGNAVVTLSLFDGEYVESSRVIRGPQAKGIFSVPLRKDAVAGSFVFNASMTRTGSDVAEEDAEDTHSPEVVHVVPRASCRAFDSYDGLSIEQSVLRASLPPVGRFDATTSSLYEKTQKPFLMLFADTRSPELTSWLRILHHAQTHYNKEELKLIFVYIDGNQYMQRMTSLGLAADPKRLPALCFNYVTETVLTWQPPASEYANGAAALTSEVVDSLVQRYFHGDGTRVTEEAAPKSLPVPKRSMRKGEQRDIPDLASLSLDQRLRFVPAMNQESFNDIVMDSAYDVAVYLYTSSGPTAQASTDGAIYVNRCAERFAELAIQTAKVVRLDMARFSLPPSVQISEVPSLVMFPAFSKDPPHQMFRGKFKVQYIMWWMQDRASRSFDLPELPHLDELEAKAYWEQKAQLPPERQQRVALDSESSVRRKALQGGHGQTRRKRRSSGSSEL